MVQTVEKITNRMRQLKTDAVELRRENEIQLNSRQRALFAAVADKDKLIEFIYKEAVAEFREKNRTSEQSAKRQKTLDAWNAIERRISYLKGTHASSVLNRQAQPTLRSSNVPTIRPHAAAGD